jgi:uncharacterized protein (DUF4415 family)
VAIKFETPEERAKRTGETRSVSDRAKAPTGQIVRKPEPSKLKEAWSALERHVDEPLVAAPPKKNSVRSAKEGEAKRAAPQSIRFPQEVLDHFGYKTAGWQKRINDVLIDFVRKSRP